MSTTYGIELEVSSLSIPAARRVVQSVGLNWQSKADGTSGVTAEIVSPILDAERLNEARTVARALASAGATVNRTTGYHVHLGADNYGIDGIAHLVINWYTNIDAIGTLVAQSRLNNRFCSSNFSLDEIELWANRIRTYSEIRNINGTRYNSLNLDSYARHRTVEVRLHHGTLNGSKITAWAEFCDSLAQYSKSQGILNSNLADTRLNRIDGILDTLTAEGGLAPATNSYLKERARQLAGEQQQPAERDPNRPRPWRQ